MVLCFKSDEENEPQDEYDAIPFGLKWRMSFGKKDTDPHSGEDILRLGSNRLVATHCQSTEYQALKLIDRHTSIPTYKVIAVYNRPEGKVVEYEGINGKKLETVWTSLSVDKKRKVISDLGRFVDQLRKMEAPKHEVIGDATLGAAHAERFGADRVGPFYSIDAFHNFMRRGHACKEFLEPAVKACHERKIPYVLKFTHGKLCPTNILVDDDGRVSAVVGWESSGWYPEYWEYVQMHNSVAPDMQEWLTMMCDVVPRYEEELTADRALSKRFSIASYQRPLSVRPPSPTPSELEAERQEIDDKNTDNTSG